MPFRRSAPVPLPAVSDQAMNALGMHQPPVADRCSKRISDPRPDTASEPLPPRLEVTIEIPRGSFRKVGSTGKLDFLSPLPCPFNYGSVRTLLGLEGDLLDAVVLGPRLAAGTRVWVSAQGAVGLHDRGLYDDKLICSLRPLSASQLDQQRRLALAFFLLYGWAKRALNLWRGRPGRTGLKGWVAAEDALARARPVLRSGWRGAPIPF